MSEDWLAVCRAAAEDVRGVLRDLPTRIEREPVVGDGVGGDETTAVDAAAERVKANGGQVIMGPMEVPDGSFVLQGTDPQGAVFALRSITR